MAELGLNPRQCNTFNTTVYHFQRHVSTAEITWTTLLTGWVFSYSHLRSILLITHSQVKCSGLTEL